MVEPGSYTVTLKLGDRTYTKTLAVDRKAGYTPGGDGFE
jgi:hypothetical protein